MNINLILVLCLLLAFSVNGGTLPKNLGLLTGRTMVSNFPDYLVGVSFKFTGNKMTFRGCNFNSCSYVETIGTEVWFQLEPNLCSSTRMYCQNDNDPQIRNLFGEATTIEEISTNEVKFTTPTSVFSLVDKS